MKKLTLKSKKGFTLIELVMVIVIVGILAAIIVPKFAGQRAQAEIATTKANLENLRTAIDLFYANEGAWPLATLADLVTEDYIRAIPKDGVEEANTVVNAQGNAGGWFWNTTTHELLPNLTGNDANGDAYSGY